MPKNNHEINRKLTVNLKRLCKQYGYSQNQIAKKLGISRSTYSYYELDPPSLASLSVLCKLYSITINNLLSADF